MTKVSLLLTLMFATGAAQANSQMILKQVNSCIEKDSTNPGSIECYEKGSRRVNVEMRIQVARLVKNLEDPGAHFRDRSGVPSAFTRHLRALKAYQATSSEIAAMTNDGTGSDMALASSQINFEIAGTELVYLEKQ